jgi:hypothetical protein
MTSARTQQTAKAINKAIRLKDREPPSTKPPKNSYNGMSEGQHDQQIEPNDPHNQTPTRMEKTKEK